MPVEVGTTVPLLTTEALELILLFQIRNKPDLLSLSDSFFQVT